MSAAIELTGVSLRRGAAAVLNDVSLSVLDGEVLALLGPSGSGKSTLVRIVLGLLAPTAGAINIGGRIASASGRVAIPPEQRRIGVVFQDLALWPHLTVGGNLAFALGRRLPRDEADARIRAMLDRVGLAAMAQRRPGDLSGGERQRVAIARALVTEPAAVILDEPLANLDVVLKDELLCVFRDVLRARHTPVLFVTHDPREAAVLADRVALLEAGRITQVGALAELLAEPATAFARAVARELRRVHDGVSP